MNRTLSAGLICIAAGASLLAQAVGSTQRAPQPVTPPPVTYTVDVSLVVVDAVVTDSEGHAIRDLRREDFQVLEDGKPQTIDRVSFVEIPIERAPAPPRPAPAVTDVRSNLHRFDGRLYVLLLDDLHTAAPRSERVKAAARRFVEQSLQPGDLAAIVHVSGGGSASQDFTSDRRLLLASIDRFGGRQQRSETLNTLDDYNRQLLLTGRTPDRLSDVDQGARAYDARTVFDTITSIARRLAPLKGRRKAMLWFGEGVAYDMFDTTGKTEATIVRESSRAAIAAASVANLAVYGVDVRGLGGLGDERLQLTSPSVDPTSGLGTSGLNQELRRSQENLRHVSNDTGGFAVVNTDELGRGFERIVDENSVYYLLGYYPAREKPDDGGFHRLEVLVKRQGVRVRARTGYSASRVSAEPERTDVASAAPPALRDALTSPVPLSSLPMAVHAAPFRGTGGKASVLVTVEYAATAFNGSGVVGSDRDRLDASVLALDPAGALRASDHASITLNVKPETRKAMEVLGLRTHARLDLAPGRYQIRAAALVAGTGLAGSVHEDVEVPDFTQSALSMSGLVLTSVVAAYTPTARFDERMRGVLSGPPTTLRDFRNDETVGLFVEIYEGTSAPAAEVVLKTEVRDAGGRVMLEKEDVRTPATMTGGASGYSLEFPLAKFAAGDYMLVIEARSRNASVKPVRRETAFQVWDVPPTQGAPQPAGTATSALPFVPVAKGAVSNVPEPREEVIRSAAEWQALWRALALRGNAPGVTFDNTMIVAVFLGARPTAGYEPEIVGVRREGDVLIIDWQEHTPRDAGNPPNRTTPFVVAGVPQHAGEVRFNKVGVLPDRD